MPTKPVTDEELLERVGAYHRHGNSNAATGRELGLDARTISRSIMHMKTVGLIKLDMLRAEARLQPSDYNWSDDSKKCYDLAIKAAREKGVRAGRLEPHTDTERLQAEEGCVAVDKLDCVASPHVS